MCKTSVNNSFTIEIEVHHPKNSENMSFEAELSGLHSAKSTRRLEQIAGLRVREIGDHVDLPQLVVCGDPSAGKSSVLEGITGLPFPRLDGMCTKLKCLAHWHSRQSPHDSALQVHTGVSVKKEALDIGK